MTDLLNAFTHSDNPVIALLAIMVVGLSSVVVLQWRYTSNNTVPKWIWDGLSQKIDKMLEVQEKLLTIMDERISRK